MAGKRAEITREENAKPKARPPESSGVSDVFVMKPPASQRAISAAGHSEHKCGRRLPVNNDADRHGPSKEKSSPGRQKINYSR